MTLSTLYFTVLCDNSQKQYQYYFYDYIIEIQSSDICFYIDMTI